MGYYIVWLIIAVYAAIFSLEDIINNRIIKVLYTATFFVFLTYVISHLEYGETSDYDSYSDWYLLMSRMNIRNLMGSSFYSFTRGIGFVLLMWLSTQLIPDYRIFYCICVVIILLLQFISLRKLKVNIPFYYLCFLAAYGFPIFTAYRQMFAMAILMFGVHYLFEDNRKAWFITVIVASLFHPTALIFIVAFFIKKVPLNSKGLLIWIGISVALFAVVMFFGDYLVGFWRDGMYSQLNYTRSGKGVFLALTIVIINSVCYYLFSQRKNNDDQHLVLLNFLVIGSCFQLISTFNYIFFRIAYYFQQYSVISWCRLGEFTNKRSKVLMYIIIGLGLFAMYYRRSQVWYPFELVNF